ncbi:uncharacterized protein si:dkeyp-110g5.4 [Mugil cephalus]|uniref:uncharacterized protein si:dkeyp-110g5.4 n=1 Tax=Mugil cephalus TaxID=48193 RepID=UPI001FB6EE7A|nr:uncharacterized protein si:dkeyp-110g5.4 [Mugil cephalus]XP_047428357.1 uncharacterized protein si:dkeyp-110g5.4 [Mugil cephalus]
MDNPSSLEIYIPVEAEVKSIPLQSLPRSILRRMGLFPVDARKLDDSPDGIWICPAVIRRKGQKGSSHTGSDEVENVSSALGPDFWATQGPIQMSFVASSRTAYKVLKNALPGIPTSDTSLLPQGAASQTNKDALVIYRGRIYLSRKTNQGHDRQKGHEQQSVSQSSSPSTSDVSHKRRKKEPQNNNRPKKRQKRNAPSKIRHDRNKGTGVREGSDVSSVKAVSPVSQPADSVQSPNKARTEHVSGEAQNPSYKEAESTDQNEENDADVQMDRGEFDQSLGLQTTRTEPLDAAASSTSLQMGCDFNELEQEERIARMKARLRMTLKNRPE